MLTAVLVLFTISNVHSDLLRVRRQYNWNPYYDGANYYPPSNQWNSHQQNYDYRQEYIQPYFTGFQHQYGFYNSPSQIWGSSSSQGGYVTGPPKYLPTKNSYIRPTYLATMKPKPTVPVVLERSAVFATSTPPIPPKIQETVRPKVLERVLGPVALIPSEGLLEKDVTPSGTVDPPLVETENSTNVPETIPTTLIANQELISSDNDYDLNKMDGSGEISDEEGSGIIDADFKQTSTDKDGIVGFRAPPLPKESSPGIEIGNWSDSDDFAKKLLSS